MPCIERKRKKGKDFFCYTKPPMYLVSRKEGKHNVEIKAEMVPRQWVLGRGEEPFPLSCQGVKTTARSEKKQHNTEERKLEEKQSSRVSKMELPEKKKGEKSRGIYMSRTLRQKMVRRPEKKRGVSVLALKKRIRDAALGLGDVHEN